MEFTPSIPGADDPWLVLAGRYLGVLPAGTVGGVNQPVSAVDTGINTFLFDPQLGTILSYLSSPAPIEEIPVWFEKTLGMNPIPFLEELESQKLLASFAPTETVEEGLQQFEDVAFVPDLVISPGQLPSWILVTPRVPLPPDIPLSPWLTNADSSVEPVLRGNGTESVRSAIERASVSTGTPLAVVYAQFSLMLVDLIAFGCGFLRRID